MIIKLALSVVAGFISHQTRGFFERNFTGAWNYLGRYAFGDLAKMPGMVIIHQDLKIDNQAERLLISYLLNSMTFGAGVVLGYIVDAIRGKE